MTMKRQRIYRDASISIKLSVEERVKLVLLIDDLRSGIEPSSKQLDFINDLSRIL